MSNEIERIRARIKHANDVLGPAITDASILLDRVDELEVHIQALSESEVLYADERNEWKARCERLRAVVRDVSDRSWGICQVLGALQEGDL